MPTLQRRLWRHLQNCISVRAFGSKPISVVLRSSARSLIGTQDQYNTVQNYAILKPPLTTTTEKSPGMILLVKSKNLREKISKGGQSAIYLLLFSGTRNTAAQSTFPNGSSSRKREAKALMLLLRTPDDIALRQATVCWSSRRYSPLLLQLFNAFLEQSALYLRLIQRRVGQANSKGASLFAFGRTLHGSVSVRRFDNRTHSFPKYSKMFRTCFHSLSPISLNVRNCQQTSSNEQMSCKACRSISKI